MNNMNEFQKIIQISSKIDGWLTEKESHFLFESAQKCKGVIVEIGAWKGRSTVLLGKGSQLGSKCKVYSIDPHTGSIEHKNRIDKVWTYDEFRKNIQNFGLTDIVNDLVMTSEEAEKMLDEKIEFLFIDGAHEYPLVELDYRLWCPKLVEGGIIALHDTMGKPGPKRVANRFIFKSAIFKSSGFIDTITYATKVEKNTIFDRLRNSYIMVRKDISEKIYNFRKRRGAK